MVRRGNCITQLLTVFLLATLPSCATVLTGKYQKISVSTSDSTQCISAYLPKPLDKIESSRISDDMAELPIKKSNYYRISQPTQHGFVILPRPNPNQQIFIGFHSCIDSSSTTLSQCPQQFTTTFNEPALLNFILPWNWMVDAYTGSIFRWKINKPLTP